MRTIFLQPCEVWFGGGQTRLYTLLGSCVAITLWHPVLHVGGMCHFMMECRSPGRSRHPDGCFADKAMAALEARIRAVGCHPEEFEAKLFGGGCMMSGTSGFDAARLPESNIAAGREMVARCGHPIVAEHLGGEGHRHLIFEIETGQTRLRFTPKEAAVTCMGALA